MSQKPLRSGPTERINRVKGHLQETATARACLGDETISYTVKRSLRARHVRLEVRPETGLTVVIPRFFRVDQVPELLRQKSRWVLSKLAVFGRGHQLSSRREAQSGDTVSYLGRELEVVARCDHRTVDSVELTQSRLLVTLGSPGSSGSLLLEQWYRAQAETLIRKRAEELCARLGVSYRRLTIREARTRWGSCSHKGNLNFNWKLIMLPEPVIDYVIVHELSHLKEMNHGKRFWELVGEDCPQWREHRKWIRDHETYLAAKLSAK